MSIRILTALCAALLLAACADTIDSELNAADNKAIITNEPPGEEDTSTDAYFRLKVGNTVHFETDRSSLSAEAQLTLQKQAAWMQRSPQRTATIEGHADERGTREYNLALGARRAQAMMDYLIALGVDPKRLKTISYGKERPVCTEANEACWSQNRRAVSVLDN